MRIHKGKLSVEQTHERKDQAKVLTVAVNMMQTVHLLPHQSIVAQVKVEPGGNSKRTLLVECGADLEKKTGLLAEDTLVQPTEEGLSHVIISNMTGCSSHIDAGTMIGQATEVEMVE